MSDREEIDFELLDRYLAGEGTPEELEALRRRIESDEALSRALIALRATGRTKDAPPSWDARSAWERLQREMQPPPSRRVYLFPDAPAGRPADEPRGWRESLPWLAVAAAALLIIAGAATGMLRRERATAAVDRPREITTTRQERATLDLADGSHVVLGPESRLIIPATFNRASNPRTRDVELQGEAVFTVAHDAARPFRVRAMGVVVSDIGTKFELRAYANDSAVSVAVSQGSVAVAHAPSPATAGTRNDSIELGVGDLGAMAKNGRLTVKRSARLTPYFSWVDGDLVFERAPLPEVVRAIGRWYDLDVRVPDGRLSARLVNAQFSTQSPSAMLDALATAVGARVEREGRVVTLVMER